MNFISFLLFLLISSIGGYLGYIFKLPVGVILGSMFAVGLSKYFDLLVFEPTNWLSFSNQVMLGLMLGVAFVNIDLKQIKELKLGLVFIAIGVFMMTFVTGFTISYLTPLDSETSIISSAPAAIAEMSILANALGLNTPIIVILHLVRVVSVILIFSFILKYSYKKISKQDEIAIEKSPISKTFRGEHH